MPKDKLNNVHLPEPVNHGWVSYTSSERYPQNPNKSGPRPHPAHVRACVQLLLNTKTNMKKRWWLSHAGEPNKLRLLNEVKHRRG